MEEEKILKCPFCPCQFSTERDFNLQRKAFGEVKAHFYKWRKVRGLHSYVSYETWR